MSIIFHCHRDYSLMLRSQTLFPGIKLGSADTSHVDGQEMNSRSSSITAWGRVHVDTNISIFESSDKPILFLSLACLPRRFPWLFLAEHIVRHRSQ